MSKKETYEKAKEKGIVESGKIKWIMKESDMIDIIKEYEESLQTPTEPEEEEPEEISSEEEEVEDDEPEEETEVEDEDDDQEVVFIDGDDEDIEDTEPKTIKKVIKKPPVQKSNNAYLKRFFPKKNTKPSDLLKKK